MSLPDIPSAIHLTAHRSTGAGGLRRSSYNTKLERRLSNSYTLPRNTTSKDILIKLEAERAKREQEKEEEKAKKEEQLFKKMGIKAPTGITHDQRRRSEGVIADLQKYRLGNVRPSRKVSRHQVDSRVGSCSPA